MAKVFNEVILKAKKTTYGELSNALVTLAAQNSAVMFSPVLSPNGTTSAEKYIMHVAKRNKSKTIGASGAAVTTSSGDVASMTTDDNLKILDSFGKYDWDSSEQVTGVLRGIGHKIGFNDEYDADDLGQVQADFIESEVGNMAITRKEALVSKIVDAAKAASPSAATASPWDDATAGVRAIRKISNDFKHRTGISQIVILVDTETKDKIAKEIGTAFYQEAPIYKTGLTSQFSVNGYPVLEVPELDQYESSAGKSFGMVIMDAEMLAVKASNEMKDVDVNMGATRFVGTLFYDITTTVPQLADRIKGYEVANASLTPEVND